MEERKRLGIEDRKGTEIYFEQMNNILTAATDPGQHSQQRQNPTPPNRHAAILLQVRRPTPSSSIRHQSKEAQSAHAHSPA